MTRSRHCVDYDGKRGRVVPGRFDPALGDMARTLPGRSRWVDRVLYFEDTAANWAAVAQALAGEEATAAARARTVAHAQHMTAKAALVQQRRAAAQNLPAELANWHFRTKPWQHQLECWAISRDLPGFAIFLPMGLGKTAILVNTAAWLWETGRIDALAVVAPAGVHRQWIEDRNAAPRHMPETVAWTGVVLSTRSLTHAPSKAKLLQALGDRDRLFVGAINIEALSHESGVRVLETVLSCRRCLLVVDESSRIKTPAANRTKALVKLGRLAPYRRIASGTPVTKGLEDLYSQFLFLDPDILGFSTYTAFKTRYCILGGYESREVVGYQHEAELQRLIAPYSYRREKSECLDLPPQVWMTREFSLSPEQRKMYRQMKDEALAQAADGTVVTANAQAIVTKLQQIGSGFLVQTDSEDPTQSEIRWRAFPNPRTEALLSVLDEAGYPPTLVWCRFREDVEAVGRALRDLHNRGPAVTYYGGNSRATNDANKAAFAEGRAHFFVGQVDAGGTGLDGLQRAPLAVYYSNSHNAESRWQSEGRNHRGGSTAESVTYVDLVARGTVDARILDTLRRRENVAVRTYAALQTLLTDTPED